ncbi:MAG: glycosyltransferase family 2 protein [Bacilli bacterium]
MKKLKKVSVCIPVYNSEKYLEKTLNSIINQTYNNIEILIGDNKSTDSTSEIIKRFMKKDNRIKYIQHSKNLGYSGNCNFLIKESSGEYIAIYHGDDLYDKTIVEKQVIALEKNKKLGGVFSFADVIDEKDNKIREMVLLKSQEELIIITLEEYLQLLLNNGVNFNNVLICPTSMIRKNIYLKLNGYDLTKKYIEDQDMWTRILKINNLGIINQKLIKYRVHSLQGSADYLKIDRKEIQIYLSYTKKILVENLKFTKYLDQIENLISKDYINLSLNNLKLKNFDCFIYYLEKSRNTKKLVLTSKHGIFQNFMWNKFWFKLFSKFIGIKK